ncbi:hypothetical protein [Streptomyces albidochromogenes]|uniref:Integrase n=1 Tax=Streptomyces albidochromogenes TaxID=329524 RepID=A0ABW6FJ90_9ACTN
MSRTLFVLRYRKSVTPTDRPVMLREEKDRAHLPAEAGREAAVVAMTSSDLERYLCGDAHYRRVEVQQHHIDQA